MLRSFELTFERIEKECGISHKGIHQCRHHFASQLLRHGVDIKVISDILGHENVNFTYNRYISTVNEQKINAVQVLDNIYKEKAYWDNNEISEWGFAETPRTSSVF